MRCRKTLCGHVDSVNYVTFQPCSNNVLTASGDKTVSMWDLRSGLCVQTFYGHANACNQAQFNIRGDTISSCDADGIGKLLPIASGDASVKIFNVEEKVFLTNLEGHDDSVQDVAFGQNDKYLVTASSDCTFCLYQ